MDNFFYRDERPGTSSSNYMSSTPLGPIARFRKPICILCCSPIPADFPNQCSVSEAEAKILVQHLKLDTTRSNYLEHFTESKYCTLCRKEVKRIFELNRELSIKVEHVTELVQDNFNRWLREQQDYEREEPNEVDLDNYEINWDDLEITEIVDTSTSYTPTVQEAKSRANVKLENSVQAKKKKKVGFILPEQVFRIPHCDDENYLDEPRGPFIPFGRSSETSSSSEDSFLITGPSRPNLSPSPLIPKSIFKRPSNPSPCFREPPIPIFKRPTPPSSFIVTESPTPKTIATYLPPTHTETTGNVTNDQDEQAFHSNPSLPCESLININKNIFADAPAVITPTRPVGPSIQTEPTQNKIRILSRDSYVSPENEQVSKKSDPRESYIYHQHKKLHSLSPIKSSNRPGSPIKPIVMMQEKAKKKRGWPLGKSRKLYRKNFSKKQVSVIKPFELLGLNSEIEDINTSPAKSTGKALLTGDIPLSPPRQLDLEVQAELSLLANEFGTRRNSTCDTENNEGPIPTKRRSRKQSFSPVKDNNQPKEPEVSNLEVAPEISENENCQVTVVQTSSEPESCSSRDLESEDPEFIELCNFLNMKDEQDNAEYIPKRRRVIFGNENPENYGIGFGSITLKLTSTTRLLKQFERYENSASLTDAIENLTLEPDKDEEVQILSPSKHRIGSEQISKPTQITEIDSNIDEELTILSCSPSTLISTENKLLINEEKEFSINTENELPNNKESELPNSKESELTINTENELTIDTQNELAIDTESEIAIDTESEIAIDTESEIAIDTESEIAIDTESEIGIDTENEIAIDTENDLRIDTENKLTINAENELAAPIVKSRRGRKKKNLAISPTSSGKLTLKLGELMKLKKTKRRYKKSGWQKGKIMKKKFCNYTYLKKSHLKLCNSEGRSKEKLTRISPLSNESSTSSSTSHNILPVERTEEHVSTTQAIKSKRGRKKKCLTPTVVPLFVELPKRVPKRAGWLRERDESIAKPRSEISSFTIEIIPSPTKVTGESSSSKSPERAAKHRILRSNSPSKLSTSDKPTVKRGRGRPRKVVVDVTPAEPKPPCLIKRRRMSTGAIETNHILLDHDYEIKPRRVSVDSGPISSETVTPAKSTLNELTLKPSLTDLKSTELIHTSSKTILNKPDSKAQPNESTPPVLTCTQSTTHGSLPGQTVMVVPDSNLDNEAVTIVTKDVKLQSQAIDKAKLEKPKNTETLEKEKVEKAGTCRVDGGEMITNSMMSKCIEDHEVLLSNPIEGSSRNEVVIGSQNAKPVAQTGPRNIIQNFPCPHCPNYPPAPILVLKSHFRSEHPGAAYPAFCVTCNLSFLNSGVKRHHDLQCHKMKSTKSIEEEPENTVLEPDQKQPNIPLAEIDSVEISVPSTIQGPNIPSKTVIEESNSVPVDNNSLENKSPSKPAEKLITILRKSKVAGFSISDGNSVNPSPGPSSKQGVTLSSMSQGQQSSLKLTSASQIWAAAKSLLQLQNRSSTSAQQVHMENELTVKEVEVFNEQKSVDPSGDDKNEVIPVKEFLENPSSTTEISTSSEAIKSTPLESKAIPATEPEASESEVSSTTPITESPVIEAEPVPISKPEEAPTLQHSITPQNPISETSVKNGLPKLVTSEPVSVISKTSVISRPETHLLSTLGNKNLLPIVPILAPPQDLSPCLKSFARELGLTPSPKQRVKLPVQVPALYPVPKLNSFYQDPPKFSNSIIANKVGPIDPAKGTTNYLMKTIPSGVPKMNLSSVSSNRPVSTEVPQVSISCVPTNKPATVEPPKLGPSSIIFNKPNTPEPPNVNISCVQVQEKVKDKPVPEEPRYFPSPPTFSLFQDLEVHKVTRPLTPVRVIPVPGRPESVQRYRSASPSPRTQQNVNSSVIINAKKIQPVVIRRNSIDASTLRCPHPEKKLVSVNSSPQFSFQKLPNNQNYGVQPQVQAQTVSVIKTNTRFLPSSTSPQTSTTKSTIATLAPQISMSIRGPSPARNYFRVPSELTIEPVQGRPKVANNHVNINIKQINTAASQDINNKNSSISNQKPKL